MSGSEEHVIPSVRMDQAMTVAAVTVSALIGTFGKPGDSEDELATLHLVCLSMFLYQLLVVVKQKEKVAGILEAIIVELRSPPAEASADSLQAIS